MWTPRMVLPSHGIRKQEADIFKLRLAVSLELLFTDPSGASVSGGVNEKADNGIAALKQRSQVRVGCRDDDEDGPRHGVTVNARANEQEAVGDVATQSCDDVSSRAKASGRGTDAVE